MALRDRMLRMAKATRLPRRTVRLRLTVLYGAVFLLCGAALLTTTYFLVDAATGNAFIEHTKNGVTIAGYQIGTSPPRIGASGHTKSAGSSTSFSAGTYLRTAGGKHESPAAGAGLVAGPVLSGTPSRQQAAQAQKHAAQQQSEFETFAHAYQSSELHQLLIESGVGLAIMAVLSVVLGWLMAGRVLRPLRTITATTRNISASNLHERLDVEGPDDELKELGETIDALLERLEASFRSQRQFVANASHELRTPLARQRTLAQVAVSDPSATVDTLRAAHERILASGEQQEQLIDALLMLSRAQSSVVSYREMDLAELAHDLVSARKDEASSHEVRIITGLRPATLECDPRLVERLAANLLDNAVRHNVAGGTVRVRTGTRSGGAWLSVANDGAVIEPNELERLFEPFERLEGERTAGGDGFGLGLCIVRAVAAAHGASVRTVARPAGGLSIEVWFPARSEGAEEGPRPAAEKGPVVPGGRYPEGQSERPVDLVHALLSDH
ncbi:MAG TPA: ATP-binding protein [Acidimicrobiales bacterium]|nr:ATP-binding protein [Acidimicrobiales bacterium]